MMKGLEKLYFFLIISISFFISFLFFNDQVAVRGGLIISDIVSYKDSISPLKFYFLNSWTLLTQISAILLKIGFSVKYTSFILVFILTSILVTSSFLILFKFTNDKKLSFIVTLFLIFFQKNLGDTDYPSLIYTIHTFGAYAQGLTGLIFASILCKKYNLTFFLSILLISIHPIIGVWLMAVLMLSILLLNDKLIFQQSKKGIITGIILLISSLILFYSLSIEKLIFDQDIFIKYITQWDGHRAKTGEIHYEYIFKTLLLIFMINLFCYKKKDLRFFLIFSNILIFTSIAFYIFFKFFYFGNLNLLSTIIPGRFMITYTFIAWPIIISVLYLKFGDNKFFKNFIYFLILTYSIMHYKDFSKVSKNLSTNNNFYQKNSEDYIFQKLSKIKDPGNVIATEKSAFNVIYLSKKPLLISKSIDFLPYHPYLVNLVSDIFTDVYGYNFNSPRRKYYPYLNDEDYKDIFEQRSFDDWLKIKNKFNSNIVIVPSDWKINLELIDKDKKFSLYKIN